MKSIFGNFSRCSCRKASRWKRSSNAAFLLGAFRERYCVVPHNGTMVVHGSTAGVADAHLWIPTQNMRDYSSQATEAAGPLWSSLWGAGEASVFQMQDHYGSFRYEKIYKHICLSLSRHTLHFSYLGIAELLEALVLEQFPHHDARPLCLGSCKIVKKMLNEDQRLEQILTIVDALADRVSDTGASVQVGMQGYKVVVLDTRWWHRRNRCTCRSRCATERFDWRIN